MPDRVQHGEPLRGGIVDRVQLLLGEADVQRRRQPAGDHVRLPRDEAIDRWGIFTVSLARGLGREAVAPTGGHLGRTVGEAVVCLRRARPTMVVRPEARRTIAAFAGRTV